MKKIEAVKAQVPGSMMGSAKLNPLWSNVVEK